METHEIITQVVTELGPLVDSLREVAVPGQGRWVLEFDDETMLCELNADEDRLYLTMSLGTLPEPRHADVLEMLLAFNSLWSETGGARLALDRPGGEVLQVCDVLTDGIDVSTLANVVESLREKAQAWKAMFAEAASTIAAGHQESHTLGAIRV